MTHFLITTLRNIIIYQNKLKVKKKLITFLNDNVNIENFQKEENETSWAKRRTLAEITSVIVILGKVVLLCIF